MTTSRTAIAALAVIGAASLLLKAAGYSDEGDDRPERPRGAEEVHAPHAPAPDAITAAEALALSTGAGIHVPANSVHSEPYGGSPVG